MPRHPDPTHTPEARPASATGAVARGASALGSVAGGAVAVGAAAVGALAIGRLAVRRARIQRLEIGELAVRRLHVDARGTVTREQVSAWVAAYERAWRTPGTDALASLFAEDAVYSPGPFARPLAGLDQIAAFWEAERDGPDERFQLRSELVAVEGETGIVRVEVDYELPGPRRYRDLWVVVLAPDGRCRAFEEWAFAHGQPLGGEA